MEIVEGDVAGLGGRAVKDCAQTLAGTSVLVEVVEGIALGHSGAPMVL